MDNSQLLLAFRGLDACLMLAITERMEVDVHEQ